MMFLRYNDIIDYNLLLLTLVYSKQQYPILLQLMPTIMMENFMIFSLRDVTQ